MPTNNINYSCHTKAVELVYIMPVMPLIINSLRGRQVGRQAGTHAGTHTHTHTHTHIHTHPPSFTHSLTNIHICIVHTNFQNKSNFKKTKPCAGF